MWELDRGDGKKPERKKEACQPTVPCPPMACHNFSGLNESYRVFWAHQVCCNKEIIPAEKCRITCSVNRTITKTLKAKYKEKSCVLASKLL